MPSTAEWTFHSEVRATDDSGWTFQDNNTVYRIVTRDGQLTAPMYPTMAMTGKLMMLKRFGQVEPAPNVRSHPFSLYRDETGGGI